MHDLPATLRADAPVSRGGRCVIRGWTGEVALSGVLALVGGGEFTPACTFDRHLLELSGGDEVVLLPTAAAYEHPQRRVEKATDWFSSLGAKLRPLDVLTRPHALDPANAATVRSASLIYLTGGSGMHLRSVLMHSAVWASLVEAWEGGAVVAGSGAGASVLCDPMVDSRGGAFTVGLGLLRNAAVVTEHDSWHEDTLHRTRELTPAGVALFGVDRCTAALRHPDGHWTVEGEGDVTLHVGGEPAPLDRLRL